MSQQLAITKLLHDMKTGSPLLWTNTLFALVLALAFYSLTFLDGAMLAGVSVWDKPAKFFLSFVVQFATVAWALALAPLQLRTSAGIRRASIVLLSASWLETAYMVFRSARGEASHFNAATPLAQALYTLMGLGALAITAASFYIGWRIYRDRQIGAAAPEAAGLGLMLGAALATVAGFYLGSGSGHWVGGDQSDATGLPFFHWSTTGGDLRVAHFIGLHAAQFVPLALLTGKRWAVYGAAIAVTGLTVATLVQAAMGLPLFRA